MNRKIVASVSLANGIALAALGVAIHGEFRTDRADQRATSLQQEEHLETQKNRQHQNVSELASDAKKFNIYRAGQNVHVENRSDGAVRHVYITWPALGSGSPVVQAVPDLPKCYEYVIPAQGKVKIQADDVPNIYWTDLTGVPWTRDNGVLVDPESSHSTDITTPDQPSDATSVNLTAQPVKNC